MFQVHRLWQRAFRLHGKGQWVSETPSHLRAKSGAVSLSAIMTVPSASWRRSGGRPSAIGQEGGPCRSGDGDLQLPRMGLLGSHAAMTRGKTSCSTACWPVMLPGPFEGRGGRLSLLVAGCDEGRGAECLELESSFGDCTSALARQRFGTAPALFGRSQFLGFLRHFAPLHETDLLYALRLPQSIPR